MATPFEMPNVVQVEAPWKDYPCPECAPLASKDKVRVVECFTEADIRYEGEQGYREHVVGDAINTLAHEIERGGFARIQTTKPDREALCRKYRISVGVVVPRVAADLDAERYAAEEQFADLVLRIACAQIDNWGSRYGHSDILKRDAKHLLWDAIYQAKQTRPKTVA